MKKVTIVGGGMAGLVCSHVLGKMFDVTVIEPGTVGGEFLAGGLKYIHRTAGMETLLDELDLPYSHYMVKGALLLKGKVHRYPDCLSTLGSAAAKQIQDDHYKKTRRLPPGAEKKSMNDPATGSKRAIRCHFPDLIESLASRTKVVQEGCLAVHDDFTITSKGRVINHDYVVITTPLWVTKQIVNWDVPAAMAMALNIAIIDARVDYYYLYDYVYTPYTPGNTVHRLSPDGNYYAVEANAELDWCGLFDDLNFLFPSGWYLKSITRGLKGHLLPLPYEPKPPENVALVGRFSAWDTRMTADVVWEKAMGLNERWSR